MLPESQKFLISSIIDELLKRKDVRLILHCGDGWGEITGAEAVRILDGDTEGVVADALGITKEMYAAWQAQMTSDRVQCRAYVEPGKRCRKNAEVQYNPSKFDSTKVGLCRIHGGTE